MRSAANTGESKLLGLELLRFVCAFAVLVWHYQHFYHMGGSQPYVRSAQPLYALLAPFYELGLYGVQFFWAISGFIFFWKYGATITEGAIGGGKFFVLRFSRLYPLHLATLLIVAALQPVYGLLTGGPFVYQNNSLGQFLLQLGMANQWGPPVPFTFNGPFWSVSAEVFVYAVFFMAMRTLGLYRFWVAAAIAGICIAIQLAGAVSPAIACAAYFFLGGMVAEAHRRARGEVGARWVAALALAVIGGFGWSRDMFSRDTAPLFLLLLLPPLLFLAAQEWRLLDRWQKPIEYAGNLTYSTYLSHFPLQLIAAIVVAAFGLPVPANSPFLLIAYLAITMLVGRLVYLRFERPAQDAIRSWYRQRQPRADTEATSAAL
ncbi:acyltransferase [Sphingomonas sp. ASV193]|uniref:acyltransferase family protein n=1 Tax=Sphingomonas sp. ASV193 TaxID=3144405 RepID=UPI0032E8B02F